MTCRPSARALRRDERGTINVEALLVLPALLVFLALVVASARIAQAHAAVGAAASSAARSASLERSAGAGQTAATTTSRQVLASRQLPCRSTSTTISTAAYSAPIGQAAQIDATATCTVGFTDLLLPGMPGSMTITSTAHSPVDTWRQRGGR